MASFDRGFKTWAERCSLGLRNEIGLRAYDPLDPKILAKYLEVQILTPKDIPELPTKTINHLLHEDNASWSALSFTQNGSSIIIHNSSHSKSRQSSNIMHELAHIIVGHGPSKIILSVDGSMAMRAFDQKQEDEADWLCGCLLLPRQALLYVSKLKMSLSDICNRYSVAKQRLIYRIRMTGVYRQLRLQEAP